MPYICAMSTKEKIVERALQLFNEVGIHQVGVREIANALQISPGNMSYHFPKKEDLIRELQNRLTTANDTAFKSYFEKQGGIADFIDLMRQIFHNQYQYRSLLLNLIILVHEPKDDYHEHQQRRQRFFRNVFQTMIAQKEIKATDADLDFLVSFMSLIGRFWLSEATISFQRWEKERIMNYYLQLITKQLSLFATKKGKAVLADLALEAIEK